MQTNQLLLLIIPKQLFSGVLLIELIIIIVSAQWKFLVWAN